MVNELEIEAVTGREILDSRGILRWRWKCA